MRRIALVGLLACKRSVAPVPVPEPPPPPQSQRAPEPEPPAGPEEQLSALYHCEVSFDDALDVEGGMVVAFTYLALDAQIGELEAEGDDLESRLVEAEGQCEAARAEWAEEELLMHEASDGDTCEEAALVDVFGAVGRNPNCDVLGVAYFDEQEKLLHHELVTSPPDDMGTPFGDDRFGPCLEEVKKFDVDEFGPGAGPSVLIVATTGSHGHYDRGGYGQLSTSEDLWVLSLREDENGEMFTAQLYADLAYESDDGPCSSGTHADWEFSEEGHLLVVKEPYNDCEQSDCEEEPCEPKPEHHKAEWDAQARTWSDLEET